MAVSDPCKAREPRVIDNDLIRQCIDYQYPKGELGRLMREEGIPMEDIQEIRFEFMNILKIDHLWVLKSLTKLQLNNNYIEKIENLEMLIHLKELDLSFNKINKIENIEKLTKVEKLSFFENFIETIENMDTLKKLRIFSIGRNRIEELTNLNHLRQFRELASLNMAENPCTKQDNFRKYVAAFLPQLVYYEYRRIEDEERTEGLELFEKPLRDLIVIEEEENARKALIEKEESDAKLHSLSFVEYLNTRHLFEDMFVNDVEGKAFLKMGEDMEDFHKEYQNNFLDLCMQIFEIGQKHYKIRTAEMELFHKTVNKCKKENQQKGIEYMEAFLDEKTIIFSKVNKLQDLLYSDQIDDDEYKPKILDLTGIFETARHTTWKELMRLELILFEQMEDVNQNFDQVLTEMINAFIEETQNIFSLLRNIEITYSENLSDIANRYLTNINLRESKLIPEGLKLIMADKESLMNAIASSHDMHLQIIDNREDLLIRRAKEWLDEYLNKLIIDEIKRNREKLLEINHYLDIQREEYEFLIAEDTLSLSGDPLEGLI